jgi:serine/threonine protein phosphatase PrpC
MFFKEPNIHYAEHVFVWSDITKMSMQRFYPLIKTPPYLTATPDITRHQRSRHDRFLVIASDGIWGLEGLSNEWAVKKVEEGVGRGLNPAEHMMAEVLKLHPGDDVTIMVVVFSKHSPTETEMRPEIRAECKS